MRLSAIGIGATVWDTALVLKTFPERDGKLPIDQMVACGGGPTANALVAMARLGLPVGYMGCVGDDEPGRAMETEFHQNGVSTQYLRRLPGHTSTVAYILVDSSAGTRSILHKRGDAPPPALGEAELGALSACRLLHVEGRYGEVDLRAARHVRAAGGLVSLDAGSPHPGIEQLMGECDLIVCSEPLVRALTGADAERGLMMLSERYRPRALAVTMGASGGLYVSGGGIRRYPAFPVTVLDSTGAGDTFHGAFAYAYLMGQPILPALTFASAAAAIKCTRLGSRAGIPTRAEVDQFLRDHP